MVAGAAAVVIGAAVVVAVGRVVVVDDVAVVGAVVVGAPPSVSDVVAAVPIGRGVPALGAATEEDDRGEPDPEPDPRADPVHRRQR